MKQFLPHRRTNSRPQRRFAIRRCAGRAGTGIAAEDLERIFQPFHSKKKMGLSGTGPGMDGLATFRRLIALRPDIKAVIISGYSETDRVQQAQRIGAGTYIRKPYTMDKPGQAVRLELRRHEP